jgi:polysaccharide export outer membrane protein
MVLVSEISAQGSSEYKIGPEDQLQVQVWQHEDLSGTFSVESNGTIVVPLLGQVQAADRTTRDLSEELKRRYSIVDPSITEVLVTVSEYRSRSVTVVGEVRNPGRLGFREIPNLWDVLMRAGGGTASADLARVQIVRKDGVEGSPRIVQADLSGGVERLDPSSLPELRPGDSVVVPSLAVEGAPAGNQVQVIGAVRTPGLFPLRSPTTVVEALGLAGGPLPEAKLEKVRLARRTGEGAVVYDLDLKGYLNRGYPPANLEVKPGDTLTVPSSGSGTGSALRTLLSVIPILTAVSSLVVALTRT